MFDLTMFFSMFCAFVAASVVMELFSFCLGLYLAKKNMKRQQAFEQEYMQALAEGKLPPGVDPMQAMMSGMPMPAGMMPTVSGEVDGNPTTGQYL
jgi:phosphatidylserine synthase